MDFEVIIDDRFLSLTGQLDSDNYKNKKVLSLANDFEDRQWRNDKFDNFIWDNIALTALSANERSKLVGRSMSTLRESAKKLRLTDKDNVGKGSEVAEIILYGIMHHHYRALSVVPKIFYKQNSQDYAKGADGVHIVLEDDKDFSLWFGEAKFYNDIADARLESVVKSVKNSLQTDKLKKENSIITSLSELDFLVENQEVAKNIKIALSSNVSMDDIKPKLHVPIMLLHECTITKSANSMNDDYRSKIREYHLSRAEAYFDKQVKAMAKQVSCYSSVNFHIILFPVPSKKEVIKRFSKIVEFYREGS